ncbi:MAG: site-2 protease family protein [Oscillospiraceae bacterium]|nr:site-2 protease family protein [Oscillospiraceae bacterium]
MPMNLTPETLLTILVKLFIIVLILPLHEFAHAWTAHKLGDDTAMYQGRLTLNPIAHIDPIGALCLLIGGFGWAKPVPIDPTKFSRKHSLRFSMGLTALAGPLSNLIASFVGMIVYRIYLASSYYQTNMLDALQGESVGNGYELIRSMLYTFVTINIGLAVFNLVPIPPLDGSKILSSLTSVKVDRWFARNQQVIRIVFLIVLVTGILSIPLMYVENGIFRGLYAITNWIPQLMGRVG